MLEHRFATLAAHPGAAADPQGCGGSGPEPASRARGRIALEVGGVLHVHDRGAAASSATARREVVA